MDELNAEDLRIGIYRNAGVIAGTTCNQPEFVMRILHLPTGVIVERMSKAPGESELQIKSDLIMELTRLVHEREPWCDCCSAGNHTTRCYGQCGLAGECCHPLYHTDWERAEREHIVQVRKNFGFDEKEDEDGE